MVKGKVTFDQDLCKGCGLCIFACPKKIIAFNEDVINKKGYTPAYVGNMDECIACGNCAIMCPDSVITVERLV